MSNEACLYLVATLSAFGAVLLALSLAGSYGDTLVVASLLVCVVVRLVYVGSELHAEVVYAEGGRREVPPQRRPPIVPYGPMPVSARDSFA